MASKQKMIRFLVPAEDAKKIGEEARKEAKVMGICLLSREEIRNSRLSTCTE